VRVRVPVTREVDYVVHVKDPGNVEEVVAALREKDPSEWETDPCFYEHLGDAWKRLDSLVTAECVEVKEG
jgi:carotenoid cleavage dioxygenase-like enzyme